MTSRKVVVALLRRLPLWFIIWLMVPVVAGLAGGIWYLAAGRPAAARSAAGTRPAVAGAARASAGAGTADDEEPAEPEPAPPPAAPATVLATGDLDFSFIAYDPFGPGRIALAAPAAGGKVEVLVAEFQGRQLRPVSSVQEQMGAIRDLTRGDLLNNGGTQAVVTTEKGLLILMGTEKYFKEEEPDLERVFVGDWDGDGRSEAAILHTEKGVRQVTVMRYTPDGKGEQLGVFPAAQFPDRTAVLNRRSGERSLLMGAEKSEGSMLVTFYSVDPAAGLKATAKYPIRSPGGEEPTSFTAGELAGHPSLAIAYRGNQGDPSYVDLFDTAGEGMPTRGRILLPDSEPYMVLIGSFSSTTGPSELLAITPTGRWVLYGLK